jgi:RHS repeat-associated protein
VAGTHFTKSFPATTNQSYTFAWDGLDAYGRLLQGSQPVSIRVGYVYGLVYIAPGNFEQSFGNFGSGVLSAIRGSMDMTLWKNSSTTLGSWSPSSAELEGWTLNVHHSYDVNSKVLHLGDGRNRSAQSSQNQIITTVAGSESRAGGISGDGGLAVAARLNYPYGLAISAQGDFYIAEHGNSRVRKVVADGTITTFAGGGALLSGYGGPATAVRLSPVVDVALDTQDNLYLLAGRPDKVTSDGIITRVPWSGSLSDPKGMTVDAQGNLYIADTRDHRIRKVTPNGITTTVAGTYDVRWGGQQGFSGDGGLATAARLSYPFGLAIDEQGNLYIGDSSNHRVRKVTPAGIISTVAGIGGVAGGAGGFSGDGGLATAAMLNYPRGLALDKQGNLYIADSSNHRIRRVSTDGVITTVAGNGQYFFSGDNVPATSASLYLPHGVALDAQNNLYIADTYNHRIRRVSSNFPGVSDKDFIIASDDGTQLYHFDVTGRHLRTLSTTTGAEQFRFTYSATGHLKQVEDADGNIIRVEHNEKGQPTAIVAADGQRSALKVDANGYLEAITNPANEITKMGYGNGGLLTVFTDPRNQTAAITYDAAGRLLKDQNAAGGFWSLVRSDLGKDNYEVSMTTALNRQTRYKVENLANGDHRRTNTEPDGSVTIQLEKTDGTTQTKSADGTIVTTIKGPDPRFGMQAPFTKSVVIKTPGGLTSNVTSVRQAILSNPFDLMSLTSQTNKTTINGRTFTAVFNASEKQFTSTTPLGRQTLSNIDGQGRVTREQVTGVETVHRTYDPRGHLKFVTQGSGDAERKVTFDYNAEGWVHSITDPLLRKTEYRHDPAGRVTKVILPDLREIGYAYDPNGNITSITPPSRPAHGFQYSAVDLETGYVPPEFGAGPKSTEYRYNLDKQITHIIRPDAQQSLFDYDDGGRLSTITAPHGVTTYSYTPVTGTLAGIAAPDGIGLSYTYDGSLPLTETLTGPVTGTVAMAYNSDFNIRALTIGGVEFGYGYDDDGLLTGAGAMSISRDARNGFITGTQLGSLATTQFYNAFGEMQNFSASQGGTAVFSQSYTRDKLGRLEQKVETVAGQTDGYAYEYNDAGRLTKVTKNGTVIATYEYDANGNRTGDGQNTATYDAQDRLMQYGSIGYTYTDNGELKSQSVGGQSVQYEYDVVGNLRKATLAEGTIVDYLIDGRNRRIGKKVNGTLVQGLLYQDQLNPVAKLNGAGEIVARFIYGTKAHVPDYMVKDGQTYRIISDHLGSVRMVVDVASGNVVQRLDYDAYGSVIQDTNPEFQPFGYAGGIYDQHTKLTRFGARDYDAVSGRWTAKDPIRFEGGDTNLYGYALNDPVNLIDPDGRLLINAAGAVLGAAAGGLIAAATGQSVTAGIASGALSGAMLGGGILINAITGAVTGGLGHLIAPGACGPSFRGALGAAGLGATGGVAGRQLGLSNGLAAARAGLGQGRVLGTNSATASGYYAQAVGGNLASGAISAAGQ